MSAVRLSTLIGRAASTDLPVTGHFLDAGPQAPSLALGLVLRPAAIAPLLLEALSLPVLMPSPTATIFWIA